VERLGEPYDEPSALLRRSAPLQAEFLHQLQQELVDLLVLNGIEERLALHRVRESPSNEAVVLIEELDREVRPRFCTLGENLRLIQDVVSLELDGHWKLLPQPDPTPLASFSPVS